MNARRLGFSLFTLAMVAVLIGLGCWQLQRRAEKLALIAALDERLALAPVPLPLPGEWSALSPPKDEFRRVVFTAIYPRLPDAMVYGAGSALRDDVAGPGAWAFLPARLVSGEIVAVNAGFVQNTMQDRAQQDRAAGRLVTGQPVTLTGYLRFPESAGSLTPSENTGKRLWFARDVPAMARALDWGSIAPFYVDLETPVPDSGTPKPGPLRVRLKNDHLQYAITWFGLAAVMTIAFGFWLRAQRRG
ncbi:SURF1 family cytochrome oxidase biogenesis protein [Bradyrhizobium sp.]|uniref:SURF1 family protein n=1 Tax=Bradyrhizobium sp. TaxID=376 RepID=UPI0025C202E6|nr:SURF1 family cytochrome oxidase biogenesis protein [Bradyrhizobium sp.]